MGQETTTSQSTSSATSSTTSSATSSSGSRASSTHIIIIVTAVIFGTLALILMSVFGFILKKRVLRRTKSNDFEKNNPYQNTTSNKQVMSTANLPSFAWERTTHAPAGLAIAAQNEQTKTSRNRAVTISQEANAGAARIHPAQGSTQSFTPLLRDVDDSNVTATAMCDPHRRAQSAGDNVIAYITYNDPGFTSNHQLRSTGLVPLQIERQPSPPSPLVSKHGSLHSITTSSGTVTSPSSEHNSGIDSRPSTRPASTSQRVMTSSLPPPLPPSICIQPNTPVVERSYEQHHEELKDEETAGKLFNRTSTVLPTPPITPLFSSRPSSSCSVNTTAASPPTPPTTSRPTMPLGPQLPPSLRPGNAGDRSTIALPVPAAAYDGGNNTAASPPTPPIISGPIMPSASHLPPSLCPGNAGNRSTVSLPVPAAAYDGGNNTAASPPTPPITSGPTMPSASHLPPSLRPGNAGNRSTLALPVPAAAHDDSNSAASKRLSTASTVSARRRTLSNPLHIQLHLNPLQQIAPAPATANLPYHSRTHSTGRESTASNGSGSSSTSASSSSLSVDSNGGGQSKSRHGKRLSSFDAHRLSEQAAAREWAQARARSRSASRSSVIPSGAVRYYAGGNNASAADAETGANDNSGAADRKKDQEEGDKHVQDERKTHRRTISGDLLRRGRDRGVAAGVGALLSSALC